MRVTAQDGLQVEQSTLYGIGVVVIGFGGNFFAGLIATIMSTYLPASVNDLLGTLNPTQVSEVGSYVGSLFLVGWALGGFALGWLGDRWGRVRIFAASLLIMGMFTVAATWAPNW